jgi:YVTN family beta-propeller protein
VLDDGSRFAYATSNDNSHVIKIDAKEFTEVARYDLGSDKKPHGLRYNNGKLYIANMNGQSISVLDVSTGAINDIPTGGITVQCAVLPNGNDACATLYDTKEVVRYHIGTGVLSRLSLPGGSQGPIQLYPTPDSKLLFVCDQGGLSNRPVNNKVYVIDALSFTVTDSITTGNKTHGVVVDDEGKYAYITNTNDNTVSVVDIRTLTVVGIIPTGAGPNGISCWHNRNGKYGGQP